MLVFDKLISKSAEIEIILSIQYLQMLFKKNKFKKPVIILTFKYLILVWNFKDFFSSGILIINSCEKIN